MGKVAAVPVGGLHRISEAQNVAVLESVQQVQDDKRLLSHTALYEVLLKTTRLIINARQYRI